ncbi:MAG: hypothetical protein LBH14_08235 [Desulfobulbaceae bacterium]|jgi:hypothetical protein|nr:hypothetical protein [Desulfobulbaceae bacterium]
MNEKEWVESVRDFLLSMNFSANIKIDTMKKLPYAREILQYDLNFVPSQESSMEFETDLLIYEQVDNVIKPRIIIEAKLLTITTHDAITYSYKAQNHKTITPFIRYGIMIGRRRHYPLPGRLFRHGTNFDFMISFQKEELDTNEKTAFVDLLKKELGYSCQLEEMLLNSRSSNRRRYFVMQKALSLIELEGTGGE